MSVMRNISILPIVLIDAASLTNIKIYSFLESKQAKISKKPNKCKYMNYLLL